MLSPIGFPAIIAGGPPFAAHSAEAAHYEVVAVSPKTTVRQNWCICNAGDRSNFARHTRRSYPYVPVLPTPVAAVVSANSPHGDGGATRRVTDAMRSHLFVYLLSPESQSGPFGPKPLFGLLAFSLLLRPTKRPCYRHQLQQSNYHGGYDDHLAKVFTSD
jgi:hypothetical protein